MGFPSPASLFPQRKLCAIAHCRLLRRASPANLLHENSTLWNFKAGSDFRRRKAALTFDARRGRRATGWAGGEGENALTTDGHGSEGVRADGPFLPGL